MLQVVLFILSVALATVDGWGACRNIGNWQCDRIIQCDGYANCGNACTSYCGAPKCTNLPAKYVINGSCYYMNAGGYDVCGRYNNTTDHCPGDVGAYIRAIVCSNTLYCDTQCEADSVACKRDGGNWNSDSCKCATCTEPDTTFKESSCAYDAEQGKYLNIVNTITRTNCEVTVKEDKYYALTCDTTCNSNSELTCLGSIDGVNVYLRSCNGKVTKCEADGSCDMAIRKVANGECENPNDPPNPNSSSGANSSSSEAGSSGSGNSSGSGDWEWLKDSLHVIHIEEMETNDHLLNFQPFITGTYDAAVEISGTAHDINNNILTSFEYLNDIKENTGNTAQNTNNINSKLTNTNQLLTDLNNKSWNVNVRPEVTVEGDTTIVNVQTDTAHSGAAILDFLKGIFKGADTTNNYNPNDTAGTGHVLDSLMGKIGELVSDSGYLTVGDSVEVMGDRMRGSYRAIMDSIGNSAISDSMNRWSEAITDNGVITGNGSDNCPDVLTQTFDIDFPIGGTVSIGPLGVYMCRPVAGLGITFWALCRVILRAMVAIFAMIWLYKSVLGIDGGSDDEN